ncbi:PDDEXK nuclease domain-containing protein [Arthrobacter sp. NPDC093128]|uniref:PDDEXK nuclease domain-containing protein n=1 Tax=Arthrobacter sp. NPDC093128 TaxID=3154979 RepID=UPI00343E5884
MNRGGGEIQPGAREYSEDTSFPATRAVSSMPEWYPELLASVTRQVSTGRSKAITAANRELLASYYAIGQDILDRQNLEGWGAKIIDRLAADLKSQFPGASGFSPRNLKYMRAFAETWPAEAIVQAPLAQLPWYHHLALIQKLDDPGTRLWYANASVEHGWSRNVLVHQIESRLHERSGQAVTNFSATMPPSDSDLAQQSLKDPYVFDFLALTDRRNERELEHQLIQHVEKFLLELGQGFAFVGEQVLLEINGEEFFADLLFYHLRLRCYVVIELKATRFEPGFLGQLGMYMAAVDDLLAHADDKPTIGLLLCKEKNNVVAEYALRGYKTPIGVAEWTDTVVKSLPEEFSASLPSIRELEAELSQDISE